MTSPVVSIITPVYNPPLDMLESCIKSVLGQSFKSFEWIVIDDESERAVAERLDALALEDGRVRVIHVENKGVSVARNTGLAMARGAYVAFVDSDDAVATCFLAHAVSVAYETDADFVAGRVRYLRDDGVLEQRFVGRPHVVVFEGDEMCDLRRLMLTKASTCKENAGLWGFAAYTLYPKLYRRDLLEDVRFDGRMTIGEDSLFSSCAVERAQRAALVDEAWYDYRDNATSTTHARDVSVLKAQLEGFAAYAEAMDAYGWLPSDVGIRYYQSLINILKANARGRSTRELRDMAAELLSIPSAKMLRWVRRPWRYHLSKKRQLVFWAVRGHACALTARLVKRFGASL